MRGADGRRFLQGQLSNDLALLDRQPSLLAGLHNPQGRALALLRVFAAASDELLAVLPAELVGDVAQRLSRYVLRAKVQVAPASDAWRVVGLLGEGAAAAAGSRPHALLGGTPPRCLLVLPRDVPLPDGERLDPAAWHALDVAAGLPQVYAATREQFVAQMLNLDALEGISFTKGCYTGQEVIARAHYRGRVKRRLQRFRAQASRPPAPGELVRLPDGRDARVVDGVALAGGTCEFLAVAPLHGADELPAEGAGDALRLPEVEALPLPYALPE